MPKGLISVELKGADELRTFIEKMTKESIEKLKKETYASGIDVQRDAKERLRDMRAWDLGNLANSIMVDPEDDGMTAKIEAQAPYGPYVEFGTRPHFPPMDALEGWAKRHGFDSAWPICKAIADRGLKERPFLIPAYLKIREIYFNRVARLFK